MAEKGPVGGRSSSQIVGSGLITPNPASSPSPSQPPPRSTRTPRAAGPAGYLVLRGGSRVRARHRPPGAHYPPGLAHPPLVKWRGRRARRVVQLGQSLANRVFGDAMLGHLAGPASAVPARDRWSSSPARSARAQPAGAARRSAQSSAPHPGFLSGRAALPVRGLSSLATRSRGDRAPQRAERERGNEALGCLGPSGLACLLLCVVIVCSRMRGALRAT